MNWSFWRHKGASKATDEPRASVAAPSPCGPFPHKFGRYRLVQYLGGGAMGAVYLAEDRKLEIQVALKVPHASILEKPKLLERFYREARAAARLDHPGLCWVLDVGQMGTVPYFAMRYIAGNPLSEGTALTPPGAATLVRSVALAMAAAHRQGIIHRDIKPANILVTPAGEPVVTDFGIALVLDPEAARMTDLGAIMGTLPYMALEQLQGERDAIGPASDVYSLGVVLYEILTGRLPFKNPIADLLVPSGRRPPPLPSTLMPGLDPPLDAICLKALAHDLRQRYASMEALAADLGSYLGLTPLPATTIMWAAEARGGPSSQETLIPREAIRFAFVGHGEQVPPGGPPPDRLYLDVGNDRRPGVIDSHQVESPYTGSTARLILAHPELVCGAAQPGRDPAAPFTIVLHKQPDLDCVASAYLAIARLATGAFPEGAEALARYVDKVDDGALGASLANPGSLYAAYQIVIDRLARQRWQDEHERYRASVEAGLALVEFVVAQRLQTDLPLTAVDALGCPGLFQPEDRQALEADAARYRQKLADPATCARQVRLRLPGEYGGTLAVEALLVRDVQGISDPQRCLFFKDWARTDAERAGNGRGFIALSVFQSEKTRQIRRAILSVTPDSGVSLRGLGARLDRAEADRRCAIYGEDDRRIDPISGASLPSRSGYDNADPWYDGRAHGYTIVDAPRSGTRLTADEIEAIFLEFGGAVSGR
jgi:hypothetical protein